MEIYSVSKVCVILFTRMLAKRLQGTGNDLLRCWITQQVNNWFLVHNLGVTVNCYHPGVVDTPAHDQPRSWANVVLWIPRRFFFKVSVFLTLVYLCYKVILLQTPYQGAQTALYLATSDEVKDITGEYFADCKVFFVKFGSKPDTLLFFVNRWPAPPNLRKIWNWPNVCGTRQKLSLPEKIKLCESVMKTVVD